MKSASEWLQDPGLYTTSAIVLCADAWALDFLEWDPSTVEMELKTTFGIQPTAELLDKIQAGSALFTSNLFFVSLETFSMICNALNFGVTTSALMTPADLDDVLWGVTEAYALLGEDADNKFSHNIARYVGCLLDDAGVREVPSILQFAELPDQPGSGNSILEDDAEMAKAYYDRQQDDRQTLESANNTKIMLLFRQLAMLPIRNGSTSFIQQVFQRLQHGAAPSAA